MPVAVRVELGVSLKVICNDGGRRCVWRFSRGEPRVIQRKGRTPYRTQLTARHPVAMIGTASRRTPPGRIVRHRAALHARNRVARPRAAPCPIFHPTGPATFKRFSPELARGPGYLFAYRASSAQVVAEISDNRARSYRSTSPCLTAKCANSIYMLVYNSYTGSNPFKFYLPCAEP